MLGMGRLRQIRCPDFALYDLSQSPSDIPGMRRNRLLLAVATALVIGGS